MISESQWNRKIVIVKESNTLKTLQLATERHRNNLHCMVILSEIPQRIHKD